MQTVGAVALIIWPQRSLRIKTTIFVQISIVSGLFCMSLSPDCHPITTMARMKNRSCIK
jgi:hypothetical protein